MGAILIGVTLVVSSKDVKGSLFQDGMSLNERAGFLRGMNLKLHVRVDHQEHGNRDERIKAHEYRATSGVALGHRHALAHDEDECSSMTTASILARISHR
jgi:hypothetical protein